LKSQQTAYKYAFIAVFLWSSVATAFKISLEFLTPIQLVFYAVVTSLCSLLVVLIYQKKVVLFFEYIKNNYLHAIVLGFINPFLYYLVLFRAYDILPAQEAQSINYTWALMLAYFSVVFLKQKLTLKDILAGIICYFGVLVIATKGDPLSLEFSNLEGVFFALFSTLLWSIYWIINTKTKVDPVIGLMSNFLFALPFISTYALFSGAFETFPTYRALLGALYVGIFEMGITFLFWLSAMQYAESTSKIANLIFISPFISLFFIHFIVGEEIFISTLLGLVMIVLGLLLQQLKIKKVYSKQ
jgi:drug/metabolite transporter (DMT)-like permease